MKAQRLYIAQSIERKPLRPSRVERPAPGAGQLLLKVRACGVCHTDLHLVEGDLQLPRLPITPGHQVVGEVVRLGEQVEGWRLGDRAGISWLHRACGSCDPCVRGEENLCERALFTGLDVDGGYAEYALAEARFALPLPPDISDEEAAPLLCAGIIGYRSLRKADLAPGEKLGLVGFGASAHLSIQVAIHWGCQVFVFTRSESHRQLARNLGAAWAGGSEEDPGVLMDRIILFAPAGDLVPTMLTRLRPGGTLAINAIHMSPIPSFPYALIYGERTLRSVANLTYRDGIEFLELAARIPIRAQVRRYELSEANQALADLKASRIDGGAVLIP